MPQSPMSMRMAKRDLLFTAKLARQQQFVCAMSTHKLPSPSLNTSGLNNVTYYVFLCGFTLDMTSHFTVFVIFIYIGAGLADQLNLGEQQEMLSSAYI